MQRCGVEEDWGPIMSPRLRRLWRFGILLGLTCGCARPLTYERWDGLRIGATADAVSARLGEPQQQQDHTWVYRDDPRGITARVYLKHGRLIGKYWADPEYGVRREGAPQAPATRGAPPGDP